MRYELACCAGMLTLVAAVADCGTSGRNDGPAPVATGTKSDVSADTLYFLSLDKPTIEQGVDSSAVGEGYPFVQVEVTAVSNPGNHPLTFEVAYRSRNGATANLGTFSLYPSNNPGKFIVATRGQVKDAGAIVLTMVAEDKPAKADTIKVTVKRITLIRR